MVPFSVTGGAWEKPVHVGYIEEETSFLGILSLRCLLQIHPTHPDLAAWGQALRPTTWFPVLLQEHDSSLHSLP